jgi:threonine aldolase
MNSAVQLHPLWNVPDGIAAAIENVDHHLPPLSMLVLENTYMPACGAPIDVDEMETLCGIARKGGLRIHVDGARIWNAAIALGRSPAELCASSDTVMFCLSKGLAAPVGSILCGPAEMIADARAHRSRLGGGMRQAGVIAAAGIVALETMVDRLVDDHARARRLADALAERWPRSVDPRDVMTNIVCCRAELLPKDFIRRLADNGVRSGTIDARTVRLVTHKDIDDADIERIIEVFDTILAET